MFSNMLSNVHNMLIFVNICTAKLGKTFPVAGWLGGWVGGWLGGEKLGIRLISASWGWGLAELGNKQYLKQAGAEVCHAQQKLCFLC